MYKGKQTDKTNPYSFAPLPSHEKTLGFLVGTTPNLIDWLQSQKYLGRKLVLCTAADISIAKMIADHLKFFDEVIASEGIQNLARRNKANALVAKYGENGFDYVGNSSVDLLVLEKSKQGVVVNVTSRLVHQASLVPEIECSRVDNLKFFYGMSERERLQRCI